MYSSNFSSGDFPIWLGHKSNSHAKLPRAVHHDHIVKVDGELSDSFAIGVGVRHGCVMSLWLFNFFMHRCLREMKAEARLKLNGLDQSVTADLFVDATVLLAESERELQRVVDQFHNV